MFLAWKGDHGPKHVHVYRDGRFVVKWDLERSLPMKGTCPKRVLGIIRQLVAEGKL